MYLSLESAFNPIKEFGALGVTHIRYEVDKSDQLSTVSVEDFVQKEIPTVKEIVDVVGFKKLLYLIAGLLYEGDVVKQSMRWEYGSANELRLISYLTATGMILGNLKKRPNYSLAQIISAHHLYNVDFKSNDITYAQTVSPPRQSSEIRRYRSPRLSVQNFDPRLVVKYSDPSVHQHEEDWIRSLGVINLAGVVLPYKVLGFVDGQWIDRIQLLNRKRTLAGKDYTHSIPGGHGKSRHALDAPYNKLTGTDALREFIEETEQNSLGIATPLCIADQVIPAVRDGEGGLSRYLTYVWRLETPILKVNDHLVATYGFGQQFGLGLEEVQRQFVLSPITNIAINAHRDPKRF